MYVTAQRSKCKDARSPHCHIQLSTSSEVRFLQVLGVVVRYIVESNDENMALLGVSLLQELVQGAAPHLDDQGWQCIVKAFHTGCSFDSLEKLLSDHPDRSDFVPVSMDLWSSSGKRNTTNARHGRLHVVGKFCRVE